KDEAARQQAETKSPVLTKTAQARLSDLQALIDRYLDDEGFKAYAEALEKVKLEPKPKPKAAPKLAPVPPPPAEPAPAPTSAPSRAAPARPAPGKPGPSTVPF